MHKHAVIVSAAILCFAVLTPSAWSVDDTATATVTLTIHEYLAVNIQSDITMTNVTPDWFGHERKSTGATLVDVSTNADATLQCLTTTSVIDGGGSSYTVDVEITSLNANPAYYSGNYMCLDFAPGVYPSQTILQSSIKKTWTFDDEAGTYTGTITLELIPKI